jgi:hypothetical protein
MKTRGTMLAREGAAMDEQNLDWLMQWQPFGTEDAKRADLRLRRSQALALGLWGKTPDDLKRQLVRARPEIPSGFELTDFRVLLQTTQRLVDAMKNPGNELMSRIAYGSGILIVGPQRYTEWEARREVVRRAIQYLEDH